MKHDDKMKYQIIRHFGTISSHEDADGNTWTRELNLVSWNGKQPVMDVRSWNEDHSRMSNGATFTQEELIALIKALKNIKQEAK